MTNRAAIAALGFAVASAIGLVLPWVRTGERSRSSIEVIGSAGALDVIEGGVKLVIVLLWFLIPVLVAAAMLALAANRPTLTAALLAPLGFVLAAIVLLLVIFAGGVVVWGAWLTGAFAVGATVSAIMVLTGTRRDHVG